MMYRVFFLLLLLCSPLFAQPPVRPTTMNIDGQIWHVAYNDHLVLFDFATGKRVPLDGLTACDEQMFWLNPDEDLADTIIHEIQHAYLDCKYEQLGDYLFSTHFFIYHDSAPIARWIMDNPEWVRFLRTLPRPDDEQLNIE